MHTLGDVLEDELRSGPTRLEKQSRAVDKRDTFVIVKSTNLGKHQQPISMVIKNLCNAYQLKWLCPCIVYSRHKNLQERLLGDLKRKLTQIWASALATAQPNLRSMGNMRMKETNHATPLVPCTRSCVNLILAPASTLVNPNAT